MMPDLLRQRLGGVEVRRVDGEIERRCHCVSNGDGGMSSTGRGAGVGAGAGSEGRLAMARRSESWRSLWSSRRLSVQREARSAIHSGTLPIRKEKRISKIGRAHV